MSPISPMISTEETQQKTASYEAAFGARLGTESCPNPTSTSFCGSTIVRGSCPSSNLTLSGIDLLVKRSGPEGNRTPGTLLDRQAPDQLIPTPYSSYLTHTNPATNWLLLGVAGLVFLILIPPAVILGTKAVPQPMATVSPLTEASNPTSPQPAAAKVYAPSDYLYLSQRYFSDAQTLSQNRRQTDGEKKEILANIQKAINTISEGISIYPNNANLWLQRANFYNAIVSIAPQAKEAALYDIQKAQNISQHSPNLPNPPNPPKGLEVIKDQQALRPSADGSGQASRDVVVAAPGDSTSPYQDTNEGSAVTGTAVLPAGQTEIMIKNTSVTDAAPIYVVPIRQPANQTTSVLSVVKKINGSGFVVALDNPQTNDISFQYWVTR